MVEGEGLVWSAPQPFEIGVDKKIDVRSIGTLFGVRFEVEAGSEFSVDRCKLEGRIKGKR